MNQHEIDIVKSTAPVLAQYGEQITTCFYRNLFEAHPELLNVFNRTNQRTGRQQTALANTVYAAAQHIDQLHVLVPVVKQIAHKHRSIGVKAEHYPIVGEFLLGAIKEVLGDSATDDILAAWKKAYGDIADIFISVEKEMYEQAEGAKGGWSDYKPFVVAKKVKESSDVYSFYLKPVDQNPLPTFLPGQYVSVRVQVPSEEFMSIRQYSLSDFWDQSYYRITVKREVNVAEGEVSAYLHDHVEVGNEIEMSAPAGDFVLEQSEEHPVVLISGGVGITPTMPMLKKSIEEHRDITFIHAVRTKEQHIFKDELQELFAKYPFSYHVAYSDGDVDADRTYDQKAGRIIRDDLQKWCKNPEASFYICGSPLFMEEMIKSLKAIGVKSESIHFEAFTPKMSVAVTE
ncbi:NO-inducible flavohemoprotein [Priestia flexa]|uniref:NO-inducible flavohemoprotein n=1 Tax=Priestia flexa TaxID=86664 RepID=UPI001C93D289|nr:NO-inducible flavohemoprotein [Priestia flexa]MBY6087977.1 NO-inducible flavohemoprotein [Priestia flexa]